MSEDKKYYNKPGQNYFLSTKAVVEDWSSLLLAFVFVYLPAVRNSPWQSHTGE
ncbi:MAG: hypothetical protein MUO63_08465 [Desulfobulbaceae bacterium]|nr:hypothetical protein [Desulfobulbaceae bacterium]